MKEKKAKESVEPLVADTVNGWLKAYGLEYYLQHQSLNSEIDYALDKALSKSGGKGGNKPDAKLLLMDSALDRYPIMIEYKGYKNKLVKKTPNGNVANTKQNNEPNYANIKGYAVNGAIHYADAVLQYTSYTDVIAIGVTGYKDARDKLRLKIGVYYVGKDNLGEGKEIGEFTDLSFLKREHFDEFIRQVHSLFISDDERKRIRMNRESQIDDALKKINDKLFRKQENLTALSRIHLVAASIMANLGIPGKVSPLKENELKSSIEKNNTDGDIIYRKVETFLQEREIPEDKIRSLMSSLYVTICNENLSKPKKSGDSPIKEIYSEVVEDLGYFYKIGLDTDFTGKLYNTMFSWLSFAGDDKNDVVLTPWYVAHLMARLCRVNMDSYVWDFATGSAGLLVAAMHQMIEDTKRNIKSPKELKAKLKRIKQEQILGVEVLPEIYMLAVLNMILMGDGSSNILEENSLESYDGKYGYGPKKKKRFPADVFLLNPPYSADGKGMVFVERALSMMKNGYAAVIIQDSAGVGQAKEYNERLLKKNTLLASIKMPKDLFRGKSMPQTSIYLFRVGERHEAGDKVRFIDFSNDGYKRSGRKSAKASKKLKDQQQAEERYDEVIRLVRNGASELTHLTHDDFIEDTIATCGEQCGCDWNFDQHREKEGTASVWSINQIVGDYLEWGASTVKDEPRTEKDYFLGVDAMTNDFMDKGGRWKMYQVKELFAIDGTKPQNKEEASETFTPLVSNSQKNNGISNHIKAAPTEEAGVITYSDTTSTKAIFYQPHPFIGFSHVKKLVPIRKEAWNENCCLFFISQLQHQIDGLFDYDHKLNKMPEIEVPLPVLDNDIAFDFMERYVEEMKQAYIEMQKDELEIKLSRYSLFQSKDE